MADYDMIHRIALNKGQMLGERTNNNIRRLQYHNLGGGEIARPVEDASGQQVV